MAACSALADRVADLVEHRGDGAEDHVTWRAVGGMRVGVSGGGPFGRLVALAEGGASLAVFGLLEQAEGAVLFGLGVAEHGVAQVAEASLELGALGVHGLHLLEQ